MQLGQEISQFRGAALDSSSVGSQAGRARPQRRCADVVAHNLARWTARIGLGEQVVTTKTLRRRFFSMAGRLTRSARRADSLCISPSGWPWETQFIGTLARLRAIPLPA